MTTAACILQTSFYRSREWYQMSHGRMRMRACGSMAPHFLATKLHTRLASITKTGTGVLCNSCFSQLIRCRFFTCCLASRDELFGTNGELLLLLTREYRYDVHKHASRTEQFVVDYRALQHTHKPVTLRSGLDRYTTKEFWSTAKTVTTRSLWAYRPGFLRCTTATWLPQTSGWLAA